MGKIEYIGDRWREEAEDLDRILDLFLSGQALPCTPEILQNFFIEYFTL